MSDAPLDRLLEIMARLRDPVGGCPWDKEQTFATIAPYTIEEAYEVADAIERGDLDELKDELGDLLLQVVFHARIAEEMGAFDFADVARSIADKMIRRHPHVFEDVRYKDVAEQTESWEQIKAGERAAKARSQGLLGDIPAGLPALTRAVKLTKRAARVGFDWPSTREVFDKLREELTELEAELADLDPAKVKDELGDVLFVIANLARKLDVEPEDALRHANAKFVRRFGHIERTLAEGGRTPDQSDLAEMDQLWDQAKALERQRAGVVAARRTRFPGRWPGRASRPTASSRPRTSRAWPRSINARRAASGALFAVIHATRQRRAMIDLLCHVCGEPTVAGERYIFPTASGGLVTMLDGTQQFGCNVPAMHKACADRAAAACPHLGKVNDFVLKMQRRRRRPADPSHRRAAGHGKAVTADPAGGHRGLYLLPPLLPGIHTDRAGPA